MGIISHVAALKERIDKQVVVKKAPQRGEHGGGPCVTASLLFLIALFSGRTLGGSRSVVLTTLPSILFLPLCAFVITMG